MDEAKCSFYLLLELINAHPTNFYFLSFFALLYRNWYTNCYNIYFAFLGLFLPSRMECGMCYIQYSCLSHLYSQVFSESRIVEYNIKEDVISPGKKEVWNPSFLSTVHFLFSFSSLVCKPLIFCFLPCYVSDKYWQ